MESNYNLNFQLLQLCSGHFLSAKLPDNWQDLTESKQSQFLENNVWHPFEDYNPEFVWQCIQSAAVATQEFIDNLNQEKEKTHVEIETKIYQKIDVPCFCGQCELDQYYQCKGCQRVCAYCFGGSDIYQDYCDYCYHELDNDLVTVLAR